MSLLEGLPLDKLTPARLWAELDAETRRAAARCLYDPALDDPGSRAEADLAISAALRFRPLAVRRLPLDKRVDYLSRVVSPGDSLAASLLRALHLAERREMLGLFLDRLGIPHRDGVIDGDHEPAAPDAQALRAAAEALRGRFERAEVDLYLASLLALDPEFWSGVADCLRRA